MSASMRHIVTDQDHRKPALADGPDQVQNLSGCTNPKGSGRLIHDYKPGERRWRSEPQRHLEVEKWGQAYSQQKWWLSIVFL